MSTVALDVRDDIRQGREPFSKIMGALDRLGCDEQLVLTAPFEPVPLFAVLTRRGFTYRANEVQAGEWRVVISRSEGADAPRTEAAPSSTANERPAQGACGCNAHGDVTALELDARGLEPPQPLVTILETLATLPEGTVLLARTDRRPMHLYPQLEARGFVGRTEEQSDGSFITHICRS
jgi:uncharacterized protein (DUF2249 family)